MARTASCLALVLLAACSDRAAREDILAASVATSAPAATALPDPRSDVWPDALPLDLEVPRPSRPLVVYLDAGHGAENNPGNSSCFCEREQDFTISLLDDVASVLEEHGMTVVPSRAGSELVSYTSRLEAARRARADAFLSLHSDIRGEGEWDPLESTCRHASLSIL